MKEYKLQEEELIASFRNDQFQKGSLPGNNAENLQRQQGVNRQETRYQTFAVPTNNNNVQVIG